MGILLLQKLIKKDTQKHTKHDECMSHTLFIQHSDRFICVVCSRVSLSLSSLVDCDVHLQQRSIIQSGRLYLCYCDKHIQHNYWCFKSILQPSASITTQSYTHTCTDSLLSVMNVVSSFVIECVPASTDRICVSTLLVSPWKRLCLGNGGFSTGSPVFSSSCRQ